MYVYKITNLINNKQYIGITNNLKKRWDNEKLLPKDPKRRQQIQMAIHKYGKENFKFECLYEGLSIEEASEKEIQLIKELNTLIPKGYNVALGGMYTIGKPMYGSDNGNSCLTYEEAKYIKDHRNLPIYLLYENYNDKITYEAFKKCYYNETYKNIEPTVDPYPYNLEFNCQFLSNSSLTYEDVIELRQRYAKGEYWKDVYEDYKHIYSDPWTFWNVYYGNRYKLVMPEVFTEENRKFHSGLSKSGELNGKSKLTSDQVKDIRKKWEEENYTRKQLYNLYPQVNPTTIRKIINYETWKNLK